MKNEFESRKWNWNEFGKLKTYSDIEEYLEGREYKHKEFCHYTSLNVINMILGSNSFRLSCVSSFNDKQEIKEIIDGKYKFSLCFSAGINENLPLWYMYSGIDGKGGRIKISKSMINKLVNYSQFLLVELDDENKCIDETKQLLNDTNMKKKFKDILYLDEKRCDMKYNTMTNHIINQSVIEQYKESNNGFWKQIAWYYEKETRLLVEIDKDLILDEKKYAVIMTFSDEVKRKIHIDLAPELDIKDSMLRGKYEHINQFILETSNINLSRYNQQIEMNMCKKNQDVIINYISNAKEKDYEYIMQKIKDKRKC